MHTGEWHRVYDFFQFGVNERFKSIEYIFVEDEMKKLVVSLLVGILILNITGFAGMVDIIKMNGDGSLSNTTLQGKNNLNFTKSVILASDSDNYCAAIPLASKNKAPLILVAKPYDRIQHFLDLYKPLHVYEVGDTPFNGTLLSEDDLINYTINESNDYVVIAKKNGEYSGVARYLASLHEGKLIFANSLDDDTILQHLKEIQPRYCALVWNPDDFKGSMLWLYFNGNGIVISKSTMTKFIEKMLTKIDSDPYIDVSFGFITGSDITDATLLISREIVYNELNEEWKNKAMFAPSDLDSKKYVI